MVSLPAPELLHQVGAVVAVLLSLGALWWLERPRGRWGDVLRSRFVLGVPWGTLVVVTGVVGFYLVAQHGWTYWRSPVTLAFSSWSYFYPLGWLTAAFAHSGSSHLIGNMTATLVVFPLAEFAFGHFPRERGSQSFASWRTNPLVRAFVVVPGGAFAVGIATSLFGWGPIIGFSGVVFAAVGFAAVRYPLAAVVAMVAQQGVTLGYRVLVDPIIFREASQRFVRPPWAGIAVQGHALGLFLGAALGILVFYRGGLLDLPFVGSRREDPPSTLRIWFGTFVLGLSLSLWALWWYRGGDAYVLYRGAGLAFVAIVAAMVAAAVGSPDRPSFGNGGLTSRQVAVLVLAMPLVAMAVVAVPLNAMTVADAGPPAGTEPVEIRDYTVVYAEDVPNQMTSVVDVEAFGETTRVNTSGVIVISERRKVWTRAVSKSELAAGGSKRLVVGGPTWRETVFVKREGWSAVGGGSAYRVRIGRARGDTVVAHTSPRATAGAVLRGRNLSVEPAPGRFRVLVTRNGSTMDAARVPGPNQSVTAGGVTFVRDGQTVVATIDGTQVDVFRKEST